jgi:addiction module HigA family antidote
MEAAAAVRKGKPLRTAPNFTVARAVTTFYTYSQPTPIGAVTPGNVLREEFMVPLGLSARALSRELGVPSNRITSILTGDRGVTAQTAILLGERFGTSTGFWLNLQVMHALEEVATGMRRAA